MSLSNSNTSLWLAWSGLGLNIIFAAIDYSEDIADVDLKIYLIICVTILTFLLFLYIRKFIKWKKEANLESKKNAELATKLSESTNLLEAKTDEIKKITVKFDKEKVQIKDEAIKEHKKELEEKKILAFTDRANSLVSILQDKKLNNTFEGLFEAFSDIPSVFENFFFHGGSGYVPNEDHPDCYILWDYLNSITLKNYFCELNKTRSSPNSMLLGSFRIYALCVSGITDLLMREYQSTKVIIWTVLRKPVWRWYNMINLGGGVFGTPEWWNRYLEHVMEITKHEGEFQMNRFIVEDQLEDKNNVGFQPDRTLYIYHKPVKIRKLRNREFSEAELEAHLKIEGSEIDENCMAYPIACNNPDGSWKSLEEDFEDKFGDFIKEEKKPVQGHQHGVFNKLVRVNKNDSLASWLRLYDDIFIVQFIDNLGKHPNGFGIAFQESINGEDRGIIIFDQTRIKDCISALNEKW